MLSPIEQKVEDLVLDYLIKAQNHYKMEMPVPDIEFSLTGVVAGQAGYDSDSKSYKLKFNPVLLEENGQNFLDRTVPHELAHIVTFLVFQYKTTPHGKEWKSVMRLFGIRKATTKHNYNLDTVMESAELRKKYPYIYKCNCEDRKHFLTTHKHNKIVKSPGIYFCKHCKGDLVRRKP